MRNASIILHLFNFMEHWQNLSLEPITEYIENIGLVTEIWKFINKCQYYQISTFGRVKSLARKNGKCDDHILKPQKRSGYLKVHIIKGRGHSIHRLVATTFIDNPKNKPQVNHKNCNKYDNTLWNLEWATRKENAEHASKNKLLGQNRGERNSLSYLTEKQVLELINSTETDTALSKRLNIPRVTINNIRIGRSWGHLTGIIYKKKKPVFTKEMVLDIFNSTENGPFFAKKYGILGDYVSMIRTGRLYASITGMEKPQKITA